MRRQSRYGLLRSLPDAGQGLDGLRPHFGLVVDQAGRPTDA
jgi:hypothetical protein